MTVFLDHARIADAGRGPKILPIPKLHRGTALWDGLHIARTVEEREKVARHRYEVYMRTRGRDYPGLCHVSQMLAEREDTDAYLIYSLCEDGRISSSLRIGLLSGNQIAQHKPIRSFLERHGRSEHRYGSVAFLARMCSSSHVGRDLLRLMMFGYYIGLSNNIEFAVLTARPEFRSLYERLGYVLIDPAFPCDGVGTLSLFGASMTDYARFLEVGSPYARIIDSVKPRVRLQRLVANQMRTSE